MKRLFTLASCVSFLVLLFAGAGLYRASRPGSGDTLAVSAFGYCVLAYTAPPYGYCVDVTAGGSRQPRLAYSTTDAGYIELFSLEIQGRNIYQGGFSFLHLFFPAAILPVAWITWRCTRRKRVGFPVVVKPT